MADYEYSSDLDISAIKKKLEQAAAEFGRFEKKASDSLEKLQRQANEAARATAKTGEAAGKASREVVAGAKQSSISLGVVAGTVAAITTKFIDMGLAAARSLLGVVEGGVALNSELETTERTFAAAFGSPDLGKEAVKFLDEVADKLNIDKGLAREFGQSILPKTDSLENFTELLRLTDIQADTTGKSMDDLKRAIRDALSGDFASLRDQFDLGPEQIQAIKDLTPTLGAAGALAKVVGDEFLKLGKVNIQDTLQTDIKAVNSQFTDLQTALGKPVFDELKKQVSDLGGVLDERGEDFALMAGSVGDVVANVLDFVGSGLSDFLRDLDTETVIGISNNLLSMVESGRTLIEVLGGLELPAALVDGLEVITGKLDEALTTASQISLLAKAEAARRAAEADFVVKNSGLGDNVATQTFAAVGLGIGAGGLINEEDQAAIKAAGQEAYNQEILKGLELLKESEKREKDVHKAQEDRRKDQGKQKPADQNALNAVLAQQQAEEEAAKAAQALADAQAKVNEKMNDLKTDQARAEIDLLVKAERAAIDAALDASRRREDLARQNLEKIADISTKNNQAIAAASTDLSRDEQDIARDSARAQVDAARQAAQRRLEIETTFRRRLQDIQRQFAESALEAERSRDAVAFLAAQRERAGAIASAQADRSQGLAGVSTQEQQAKEQARIDAERAREDAKLENQRKLEDLNTQLQQELEAQRQANEQAIEDARIAEERKAQDLATARQREEEDLVTRLQRKQEDLETSLSAELALIAQSVAATAEAEKQKTAITTAEIEKRMAAARREIQLARQAISAPRGTPANETFLTPEEGRQQKRFEMLSKRAAGGPVMPGSSYGVAEARPEIYQPYGNRPGQLLTQPGLFTPPAPGRIIPNINRMVQNVPAPAQSIRNIDNSLRADAQIQLSDPTKLSAPQQAIIRNIFQTELQTFLRSQRRAGTR